MNDVGSSNQIFKLKDGRNLNFAEFGDPNGKPIFYFHGQNSSNQEIRLFIGETKLVNCRIIAVNRPGINLSDFVKYTILDYPDDIIELADSMNIEKFAVLGGSGGAPFVCACAYKIPDRVTICGIVSGLAPIEFGIEEMEKKKRTELFLARRMNWLFKMLLFAQRSVLKKVEKKTEEEILEFFTKMAEKSGASESDKKILLNPNNTRIILNLMSEALFSIKGVAHVTRLYSKSWGFDLKDILKTVKFFLWHGEQDKSVPVSMARKFCQNLPNCTGKFIEGEGHFSTFVNHFEEIINTLIGTI